LIKRNDKMLMFQFSSARCVQFRLWNRLLQEKECSA
jgi:hypothetical protein